MTEPACTARWAAGNGSHRAGDLCGQPAAEQVGDSDVCPHHYKRALDWFYKRKIGLPEQHQRAHEESMRRAAEATRAAAEARGVVYYIRRTSDGMIKIGTITVFRRRMATHRREHGEIQILLTHGGAAKDEHAIHQKFDVYRIGGWGSEWFRPARPLLNWILSTRSTERHKKTQGLDILPVTELRKLIKATPKDAYQWQRGHLVLARASAGDVA